MQQTPLQLHLLRFWNRGVASKPLFSHRWDTDFEASAVAKAIEEQHDVPAIPVRPIAVEVG